jgi:hypothetical protein
VKRDSGLYFALVLSYEFQHKKFFPVDPCFAKWTTKNIDIHSSKSTYPPNRVTIIFVIYGNSILCNSTTHSSFHYHTAALCMLLQKFHTGEKHQTAQVSDCIKMLKDT